MYSDADRKLRLEGFLEKVADLSDKELQAKAWVRLEESVRWMMDMSTIIGEFLDHVPVLADYRKLGITEEQLQLLMELYGRLRLFDEFYRVDCLPEEAEQLIALPEWQAIIDLSQEILRAFDYKTPDYTS